MLFRSINSYLLKNPPSRTMPHLKTYIETLNIRRNILTGRYVDSVGYESNIVVLLRKILADADIPALLNKKTDLDCYFDTLIYTAQGLNSIFDAVTTGLKFYDMVIMRSSVYTNEFIIPVQCKDPIGTLPFDQGWDAWKDVAPLRLIDVDSLELTQATYQDQIKFSKYPPTRAVITIDVVALVLQYINFLRESSQDLSQPEYIHQYVLIHLLSDLEDIWLSNVYNEILLQPMWTINNVTNNLSKKIFGDKFWGFIGSEFNTALRELILFISMCHTGNISPPTLLASLPLSSKLVPEYLQQLVDTTSTENHRQIFWMEYLRDIRWMKLMFNIYQLQPDFIAIKNLKTALRRDLPLLINQKFWNNCHDVKTGTFIQNDIQNLLDRCN